MCVCMSLPGNLILHFLTNLIYCHNLFIAAAGAAPPGRAPDKQTSDHKSQSNKDSVAGNSPEFTLCWK